MGIEVVEPIDAEHPLDDRGGDYQPQLRAADEGALVGAHHGLRAGVITRQGCGQVRDQRGGSAVDDRQQLFADLASSNTSICSGRVTIACPSVHRRG